MAEAILKTNCPQQMKKYGRKVTPFDKKIWTDKSQKIVTEGNMAKVLFYPQCHFMGKVVFGICRSLICQIRF